MTAKVEGEVRGLEGLSKKEKGLLDMNNRVVTAGDCRERGVRGTNGNGKKYNKKDNTIYLINIEVTEETKIFFCGMTNLYQLFIMD